MLSDLFLCFLCLLLLREEGWLLGLVVREDGWLLGLVDKEDGWLLLREEGWLLSETSMGKLSSS